jgi:hypothetical protein
MTNTLSSYLLPTMSQEKLPEAIDLSHHLSSISRARALSPLKGFQKYWGKPGLISLAGGMNTLPLSEKYVVV